MESSGGSEDSESVVEDFWGEVPLWNDRVFRSARPDTLEDVDETLDGNCVVLALEDRRGSRPAIACSQRRR